MTETLESGLSRRDDGTFDARTGAVLATTSREFFCEQCGKRCTRGTEGTEYGHRYGCPDRPDDLPTGDSSEYERYKRRNGGDGR